MPKYAPSDIRNIALCGHGGAGKTTLADTLLNTFPIETGGTVKKLASVDDGTSICDFDEEEKAHKYTIESSVIHFEQGGKLFNIIDTPGKPDFIGQTIGALNGVDTAAVIVNASSGIEVNTRRVFAEAKKLGLGRIIVLNKMDDDKANFEKLLKLVKDVFGPECVPFNTPDGEGGNFKGVQSALADGSPYKDALLETIVTVDEAAMEKYLEGEVPTGDTLSALIQQAMLEGALVPVVCVSGKTKVGLNEMLEVFAQCGLAPDKIKRNANSAANNASGGAAGDEVEIKHDAAGQVIAQVFKTRIDPFVQKLSFLRVYSGTLKNGQSLAASTSRRGIKIAQLFQMQANENKPIDEATPGMIVAVAKLEELETGTTLGDCIMEPIVFPTPMVGLSASPKSRGDEAKLSGALMKVSQEDPTFTVERNEQTKQLVITGMSEQHLLVVQERLKRRDKVELDTKEPKIAYRETIQSNADGMYRHKKQSGGAGQFGEVHIRMYPFPKGTDPETYATNKGQFPSFKNFTYDEATNFLWVDCIVGGVIPSNFFPAIEKGFKERMNRGVIAGYQVQDVCVELYHGKYHDVDSNEHAFRTAGSMAFKEVFQKAKPALLEPIVKMEITVPMANVGDVNSDLPNRRGRPLGIDDAGGGMQTITAEVPLAEVTTYNRTLASMTGGQGSYGIEFLRYDIVPGNVQQQIIASAQLADDEE